MIDLVPEPAVKTLRKLISKNRYNHCLGVLETSILIADAWEQFPVDRSDLTWAALFHDCAKEIDKDEIGVLIQNGKVRYGRELLNDKKLAHAPLGAVLLKERFDVHDPEILKAVAYHPTGSPSLTPIGWIVFSADYLEPGRTYFNDREELLRLTLSDPLEGMRRIARSKKESVIRKNKPLHPAAEEFLDYLNAIRELK